MSSLIVGWPLIWYLSTTKARRRQRPTSCLWLTSGTTSPTPAPSSTLRSLRRRERPSYVPTLVRVYIWGLRLLLYFLLCLMPNLNLLTLFHPLPPLPTFTLAAYISLPSQLSLSLQTSPSPTNFHSYCKHLPTLPTFTLTANISLPYQLSLSLQTSPSPTNFHSHCKHLPPLPTFTLTANISLPYQLSLSLQTSPSPTNFHSHCKLLPPIISIKMYHALYSLSLSSYA